MKKVLFILILLTSCARSNVEEYQLWVTDYNNNLHQEVISNSNHFDIQLIPVRFKSIQNLSKNDKVNYEENLKEWEGTISFLIDVKIDENLIKKNFESEFELKQYLAYRLGGNISISNKKIQLLHPVFTHLESGFLKKNTYRLNIIFDDMKLKNIDKINFYIKDSIIGEVDLKFDLKKEKKYKIII